MRLVALAVAGLWLMPGCSLLFLKRVPADYSEGDHVKCTASRGLPGVDTFFALVPIAALAYSKNSTQGSNTNNQEVLALSWAIVFAGSAIYGFYETSQCQQVQRAQGVDYYPPPVPRRAPRPYTPPGVTPEPPSDRSPEPPSDQASPEPP